MRHRNWHSQCAFWLALLIHLAGCANWLKANNDPPAERQQTLASLLSLFPIDTETITVAQKFEIPDPVRRRREIHHIREVGVDLCLKELTSLRGATFLKRLVGRTVTIAVRGERNFHVVNEFGALRSESCVFLIFDKVLTDVSERWRSEVRDNCSHVTMMTEQEVFVFPKSVATGSRHKLKEWESTCLAMLDSRTIVCATSDRFLKEILARVESKPLNRALPDTLPEWRQIDKSAPAWMIRHLPATSNKNRPQRLVAVTWVVQPDQFRVNYFPTTGGTEDLDVALRDRWQPKAKDPELDADATMRRTEDGSIEVTSPNESSSSFQNEWFWMMLRWEGGTDGDYRPIDHPPAK